MDDMIKVKGHIKFELFDETGSKKDEREIDNLIVTVGKTYLAAWLAAASQAGYFMQYVGLGTGTDAPDVANTGLQIPLATRVAGALTSSTNVWQNIASFAPGVDTGAVTEAGVFSAASSGTLLARQTFAVINKAAGDTLQVTWQITFS